MTGQAAVLRWVAVVLVVAAAGCEGSSGTTSTPPTSTTTTIVAATTTSPPTSTSASPTTTAPPTTTTRPATTTTEDGVTRLDVAVSGGEVEGGLRVVPVEQGADVELTVTADVADEVHLHGYDVFAEVAPGAPATIAFTASIPGIFEVELERAGLALVELEIS